MDAYLVDPVGGTLDMVAGSLSKVPAAVSKDLRAATIATS